MLERHSADDRHCGSSNKPLDRLARLMSVKCVDAEPDRDYEEKENDRSRKNGQ